VTRTKYQAKLDRASKKYSERTPVPEGEAIRKAADDDAERVGLPPGQATVDALLANLNPMNRHTDLVQRLIGAGFRYYREQTEMADHEG
jgi:hypothetical protein